MADEALASVDNSLATASDVVTSVRSSVGAVAGGLSDVADALGAGDAALGQLQQLVDTLPASLQSVSGALNTLGGVADDIDQTLAVVGQAPLIPDYHPALGNLVRQLQQGIDPLLTSTQGLAGELTRHAARPRTPAITSRTLAADIRSIDASLARASEQLTAYRSTTAQARTLAQSARDDLDRDLYDPAHRRAAARPRAGRRPVLPLRFGAALLWPAERRLVTPFEPRGGRRRPARESLTPARGPPFTARTGVAPNVRRNERPGQIVKVARRRILTDVPKNAES